MPMQFAPTGQPVSVCHQWSITGTLSCSCAQISVSGSHRSPARKSAQKPPQIIFANIIAIRILTFNGSEDGWCCEKRAHPMLGNDPPERTGIRGADRLSFVQNCRTTFEKGCIHGVGVSNSPTNVRSRPINFAGIHTVDILHAPIERNQMSAVVAHNAFRHTRCARSVEDIKGICCGNRYAIDRSSRCQQVPANPNHGQRPWRPVLEDAVE